MPMLEGQVDAALRGRPHRDHHAAALLDRNGGVRATLEVASDRTGHARLLQLAEVQAQAGGFGRWKGRAAMGRG